MGFDLNVPTKVRVVQEAFLTRKLVEYTLDRPSEAWQWMNQSRILPPDKYDWVRGEVFDSWQRCLEDYQLPLGKFAYWDRFPCIQRSSQTNNSNTLEISRLLRQLSHNFEVFLRDAGLMLVLAHKDGSLAHIIGDSIFTGEPADSLFHPNTLWSENVLGTNGIGTALYAKQPMAFQGMEHYLSLLHPLTTIGYPLLDDNGELVAVLGLIGGRQERVNSLFAFLHLISVLVNTNLPLTRDAEAQQRVLDKIPLKTVKKCPVSEGEYSEEFRAMLHKAVRLLQHKIPILITGESGVGKDHFVNLLKNSGPRRDQPLVAINCASIPHDLIESELFGYEAGSFTGAKNNGKPGKFLLADKGILFLDEIGDMSLDLQATLLRVLETSEFTPVGGTKPIKVDVQIVAATNVRLLDAVEAGRFRRDLYYRLNGAQIKLQPLRERSDKVWIIRQIMQRELARLPEGHVVQFSDDVLELIDNHPWPGNIRQLINVLRTTIFTAADSLITTADLPTDFLAEINRESAARGAPTRVPAEPVMELPLAESAMSLMDWERHGITMTLRECEGNISIAAKRLGITRTTLYKKIERFGLNRLGLAG